MILRCCPIHGPGAPIVWHRASNVTERRADGHEYHYLVGCTHCDEWQKREGIEFVKKEDREAVEAKWANEAEALFAKQTARWSDQQRADYRAKIWPVEKPDLLAEAIKRFNDALET